MLGIRSQNQRMKMYFLKCPYIITKQTDAKLMYHMEWDFMWTNNHFKNLNYRLSLHNSKDSESASTKSKQVINGNLMRVAVVSNVHCYGEQSNYQHILPIILQEFVLSQIRPYSYGATSSNRWEEKIPYCISRITGGLENASFIYQQLNSDP